MTFHLSLTKSDNIEKGVSKYVYPFKTKEKVQNDLNILLFLIFKWFLG